MTAAKGWPVRIAALGPIAVGTALWRAQAQLCVTVMAKGTFELVPDAVMRLLAPEPLCTVDRHVDDSPNRSLRVARETAPQRSMAEVVVLGNALAPPAPDGTARATRSAIRLAVLQGQHRLIDKTVLVLGDRKTADGEPATFDRIWHGWERCLGGIGCADNPLGVGLGASTEAWPNFVDPNDPEHKVTCLGPLPGTFPARRMLLGGAKRSTIETSRIAEIGTGFDWDYFQCAMPDQRTRQLRGNEWIELDGMTEELHLRTRLPAARVLAHNYGTAQPLVPDWIPLVADLVQLHADRRRCTIVWRGGFPVDSEQAAAELSIGMGIELEGQPMHWPQSAAELAELAAAHGGGLEPEAEDAGGPGAHEAEHDDLALAGATVALDTDAPRPGRELPWETTHERPVAPPAAGAARKGLPFRLPTHATAKAAHAPPAHAPTPPRKPGSSPLEGTAVLTAADLARAGVAISAPFDLASPQPHRSDATVPEREVPGAPWSDERLEPLPPTQGETTITLTQPPRPPGPTGEETAEAQELRRAAEAQRKAEAAEQKQAEERAQAEREQAEERAQAERKQAEERAEAEQRAAEAAALRDAEAKRFAEEQEAARVEAERRAAEEAAKRKHAAAELRTGMYNAFKRKR